MGSRHHHGVRHTRHRVVGEALAAPVAGRFHAHQAGILPVLHVARQPTVLDQDGPARRRPLVIDGQRSAPVGDRAVVDDGYPRTGDALSHQAGEGRRLLAVEIAFETVADRFVQEDPRPAGPEHDLHLAGRRRHRPQIDECLAERLVDGRAPALGGDDAREREPSAGPETPGFLAVALADDHRHVQPDEGTDIGEALAAGAQDLYGLPFARQAGHDLAHAGVLRARVGVDFGQQFDLVLEGHEPQGICVGVEARPTRGGGRRDGAGMSRLDRPDGCRRARHRRVRQVGRMGIADAFARYGAQAETLARIEGGALQSAVVEGQRLALAIFEEQLAVIGPGERVVDLASQGGQVETSAVEEQRVSLGEGAHGGISGRLRGWGNLGAHAGNCSPLGRCGGAGGGAAPLATIRRAFVRGACGGQTRLRDLSRGSRRRSAVENPMGAGVASGAFIAGQRRAEA